MKINVSPRAAIGALVLALLYLLPTAYGQQPTATVRIDADKPGIRISPTLYGMFFEEINRAGDGGLYAEMVQNRSFEDADQPKAWAVVAEGGAEAGMALDKSMPLNEANARSLRLTVSKAGSRAGIANSGFGGGMPIKRGAAYLLSFYARGGEGFEGTVNASLESKDGARAYAKDKFASVEKEWKQYACTLTAEDDDPAARLVLSTTAAGRIFFDMVSLFPKDTWKGRGRTLTLPSPGVPGEGSESSARVLRRDLGELLADLKLTFVRFPGGCYVEGDVLANAFRWKNSIGDIAARPGHWNLWGYRSTDGLGYHEYLQMCEDLGAEPLFVINCGMSHKENVPLEKMGEFVQDALDAIEYANGGASRSSAAKLAGGLRRGGGTTSRWKSKGATSAAISMAS